MTTYTARPNTRPQLYASVPYVCWYFHHGYAVPRWRQDKGYRLACIRERAYRRERQALYQEWITRMQRVYAPKVAA